MTVAPTIFVVFALISHDGNGTITKTHGTFEQARACENARQIVQETSLLPRGHVIECQRRVYTIVANAEQA